MLIRVSSEHPQEHWGKHAFDGLTVLDLGAGDFGRAASLPYPSTPEWWLDACGAKRVIAVDADATDSGMVADARVMRIHARVDSPRRVSTLVRRYAPDVVKIDIEGDERHAYISSLPASESVRWVMVEAHSFALDMACRRAFASWSLCEVRVLTHVPHWCCVLTLKNPRAVA